MTRSARKRHPVCFYICGYNIVLLIGIFSTLTVGRVGRRRAFYISVIGLMVYAVMVGGSASVVRATSMGILLLWADHLGRPYAAPNTLFASRLGQIAAWTARPWLTWTLGVIALFAQVPFAAIPLEYVPPLFVAAYYAVLIGLAGTYGNPGSKDRP